MNTSCRYISAISLTAAVALGVAFVGCIDMGDPVPTKNPPSLPELSVSDVSVNEGDTAVFTISSAITDTIPIIFAYATAAGTADENIDFIPVAGLDTILPGSTSVTVRVVITDDVTVEPSEDFTLAISAPVNAIIVKGTGVCTIAASDFVGVSFATGIKPLLDNSCLVSCHGLPPANGNFSVISYANVTTSGDHGPNVIPGNGAGSNLYLKVTANPPPFGDRMPLGATPLTLQQQQLIRDWIDQGAPDN